MTQFLPDTLLALFAARPPIEYKSPPDDLLINRKRIPIDGISKYVGLFEDPVNTPMKAYVETKEEKRQRRRKEKQELLAYKIEQGIAMWTPAENPKATPDPYKTLFVGRINYETSEYKLRREFEKYGKIQKIIMVSDKNGKPRGYAFIEYSHKSEMSAAYKKADGMKIDGRRVVVDYERGRTQKTWLPRRLGGGKGDTRRIRESKAVLLARELENGGDSTRAISPYRASSHSSSHRRSRSRDRGGERERGSRDRDRGSRERDRGSREREPREREPRERDRDRSERDREDGRGDRRDRDRERDRDDRHSREPRHERDRSRR